MAGILIITFLFQDLLWANPEIAAKQPYTLQVQPLSKNIVTGLPNPRDVIRKYLVEIFCQSTSPDAGLLVREFKRRRLKIPIVEEDGTVVTLDFKHARRHRGEWKVPCFASGVSARRGMYDAFIRPGSMPEVVRRGEPRIPRPEGLDGATQKREDASAVAPRTSQAPRRTVDELKRASRLAATLFAREGADITEISRMSEIIMGLGFFDRRAYDNGLLSANAVIYSQLICDEIDLRGSKEHDAPVVGLYGAAGADASRFFLSTEADIGVLVSKNETFEDSQLLQAYLRDNAGGRDDIIKGYKRDKKREHYSIYEYFQWGAWLYLECELDAIGATDIQRIRDNDGVWHIIFQWNGREREIIYLHDTSMADLRDGKRDLRGLVSLHSKYKDTPNLFEKFDVYYQCASEQLTNHYDEYVEFVCSIVKPRGWVAINEFSTGVDANGFLSTPILDMVPHLSDVLRPATPPSLNSDAWGMVGYGGEMSLYRRTDTPVLPSASIRHLDAAVPPHALTASAGVGIGFGTAVLVGALVYLVRLYRVIHSQAPPTSREALTILIETVRDDIDAITRPVIALLNFIRSIPFPDFFKRLHFQSPIIIQWLTTPEGMTFPGSIEIQPPVVMMAISESRGGTGRAGDLITTAVRKNILEKGSRVQGAKVTKEMVGRLTVKDLAEMIDMCRRERSPQRKAEKILGLVKKYGIGKRQAETIVAIIEEILPDLPAIPPAVEKNDHPKILFVAMHGDPRGGWNPGEHLTMGPLIAALSDREFLARYFQQLNKPEFLRDPQDYPHYDLEFVNLRGDTRSEDRTKELEKYIASMDRKPDVICMSAYSENLPAIRDISTMLDRQYPNAMRIIGGPHASIDVEDALKKTKSHIAAYGEGVETLCELATVIAGTNGVVDLSDIHGIGYVDTDGAVHTNEARRHLFTLDEYPHASKSLDIIYKGREHLRQSFLAKQIAVLTGMGCPFNCSYCGSKTIRQRTVRLRSPQSIIAEMKELYREGFRHFDLLDENFCANRQNALEFTRLVREEKERGGFGDDLVYQAGARANDLDREIITAMRETGLVQLSIGFECADQKVLERAHKSEDLNKLKEMTQYANGLGIGVLWYTMVGLPDQGWQSILKSARYFDTVRPLPWGWYAGDNDFPVLITVPYPGTDIARDDSVRIIDAPYEGWIPPRTPEGHVRDGIIVGENYTETDAMAPREIFEARIFLHDFYYLYLQSVYPGSAFFPRLSDRGRIEVAQASRQTFYAIFRRAVRDIIVNAQEDLNSESRKKALEEIQRTDGAAETRLDDFTASWQRDDIDILYNAVADMRFTNGFTIMKNFGIGNRIKWMKLNAMLWALFGKQYSQFKFDTEAPWAGPAFDRLLEEVSHDDLNKVLHLLESGEGLEEGGPVSSNGDTINAFGFAFNLDREHRTFVVQTEARRVAEEGALRDIIPALREKIKKQGAAWVVENGEYAWGGDREKFLKTTVPMDSIGESWSDCIATTVLLQEILLDAGINGWVVSFPISFKADQAGFVDYDTGSPVDCPQKNVWGMAHTVVLTDGGLVIDPTQWGRIFEGDRAYIPVEEYPFREHLTAAMQARRPQRIEPPVPGDDVYTMVWPPRLSRGELLDVTPSGIIAEIEPFDGASYENNFVGWTFVRRADGGLNVVFGYATAYNTFDPAQNCYQVPASSQLLFSLPIEDLSRYQDAMRALAQSRDAHAMLDFIREKGRQTGCEYIIYGNRLDPSGTRENSAKTQEEAFERLHLLFSFMSQIPWPPSGVPAGSRGPRLRHLDAAVPPYALTASAGVGIGFGTAVLVGALVYLVRLYRVIHSHAPPTSREALAILIETVRGDIDAATRSMTVLLNIISALIFQQPIKIQPPAAPRHAVHRNAGSTNEVDLALAQWMPTWFGLTITEGEAAALLPYLYSRVQVFECNSLNEYALRLMQDQDSVEYHLLEQKLRENRSFLSIAAAQFKKHCKKIVPGLMGDVRVEMIRMPASLSEKTGIAGRSSSFKDLIARVALGSMLAAALAAGLPKVAPDAPPEAIHEAKDRLDTVATQAWESVLINSDLPLQLAAGEGPAFGPDDAPAPQEGSIYYRGRRYTSLEAFLAEHPDERENIIRFYLDPLDGTRVTALGRPGAHCPITMGKNLKALPPQLRAFSIITPALLSKEEVVFDPDGPSLETSMLGLCKRVAELLGKRDLRELRVRIWEEGTCYAALAEMLGGAGITVIRQTEVEMLPLLAEDCDIIIGVGMTETASAAAIAKNIGWRAFFTPIARESIAPEGVRDLRGAFRFNAEEEDALVRYGLKPGVIYDSDDIVGPGENAFFLTTLATNSRSLGLPGPAPESDGSIVHTLISDPSGALIHLEARVKVPAPDIEVKRPRSKWRMALGAITVLVAGTVLVGGVVAVAGGAAALLMIHGGLENTVDKTFGPGAAAWLASNKKREEHHLREAVKTILADKPFMRSVAPAGSDFGLELVRYAVNNNMQFGTARLDTFTSRLRIEAPDEVRSRIPRIGLSLEGFVDFRLALEDPRMKRYLASIDFRKASREDKLALLVSAIRKAGLRCPDETLAQFYDALPPRLNRRVSRDDFERTRLPPTTFTQVRELLENPIIRDYLRSDSFTRLKPGGERLNALIDKLVGAGADLKKADPYAAYTGLPRLVRRSLRQAQPTSLQRRSRSAHDTLITLLEGTGLPGLSIPDQAQECYEVLMWGEGALRILPLKEFLSFLASARSRPEWANISHLQAGWKKLVAANDPDLAFIVRSLERHIVPVLPWVKRVHPGPRSGGYPAYSVTGPIGLLIVYLLMAARKAFGGEPSPEKRNDEGEPSHAIVPPGAFHFEALIIMVLVAVTVFINPWFFIPTGIMTFIFMYHHRVNPKTLMPAELEKIHERRGALRVIWGMAKEDPDNVWVVPEVGFDDLDCGKYAAKIAAVKPGKRLKVSGVKLPVRVLNPACIGLEPVTPQEDLARTMADRQGFVLLKTPADYDVIEYERVETKDEALIRNILELDKVLWRTRIYFTSERKGYSHPNDRATLRREAIRLMQEVPGEVRQEALAALETALNDTRYPEDAAAFLAEARAAAAGIIEPPSASSGATAPKVSGLLALTGAGIGEAFAHHGAAISPDTFSLILALGCFFAFWIVAAYLWNRIFLKDGERGIGSWTAFRASVVDSYESIRGSIRAVRRRPLLAAGIAAAGAGAFLLTPYCAGILIGALPTLLNAAFFAAPVRANTGSDIDRVGALLSEAMDLLNRVEDLDAAIERLREANALYEPYFRKIESKALVEPFALRIRILDKLGTALTSKALYAGGGNRYYREASQVLDEGLRAIRRYVALQERKPRNDDPTVPILPPETVAARPDLAEYAESILTRLGQAYFGLQQFERSAETFTRLRALNPRSWLGLSGIGGSSALIMRLDDALAAYQQALAITEEDIRITDAALLSAPEDEERDEVEAFRAELSERLIQSLHNAGNIYCLRGEYDTGKAYYDRVREEIDAIGTTIARTFYYHTLIPTLAEYYYGARGDVAEGARVIEEAIRELRGNAMLVTDPVDVIRHLECELADLYLFCHQPIDEGLQKAIDTLETARAAAEGDSTEIPIKLAEVYLIRGEPDTTIAYLEELRRRGQEDATILTELAAGYCRRGESDDLEKAERLATKALADDPSIVADVAYLRALALFLRSVRERDAKTQRRMQNEALRHIATCRGMELRHIYFYYLTVLIYSIKGETAKATQLLKRFMEQEDYKFSRRFLYAFRVISHGDAEVAAVITTIRNDISAPDRIRRYAEEILRGIGADPDAPVTVGAPSARSETIRTPPPSDGNLEGRLQSADKAIANGEFGLAAKILERVADQDNPEVVKRRGMIWEGIGREAQTKEVFEKAEQAVAQAEKMDAADDFSRAWQALQEAIRQCDVIAQLWAGRRHAYLDRIKALREKASAAEKDAAQREKEAAPVIADCRAGLFKKAAGRISKITAAKRPATARFKESLMALCDIASLIRAGERDGAISAARALRDRITAFRADSGYDGVPAWVEAVDDAREECMEACGVGTAKLAGIIAEAEEFLAAGEYGRALAACDEALRLDGTHEAASALRVRIEEARLLRDQRNAAAAMLLMQAEEEFAAKRYAEAIAACAEALAIDPGNETILTLQGRIEEASAMHAMVDADLNTISAKVRAARALIDNEHDPDRAMEELESAAAFVTERSENSDFMMRRRPSLVVVGYIHAAREYRQANRIDRAVDALRRAYAFSRRYPMVKAIEEQDPYIIRGYAQCITHPEGATQLPGLIQEFEEINREHPTDGVAQVVLGLLYLKTRQYPLARDLSEVAQAMIRSDAPVFEAIGRIGSMADICIAFTAARDRGEVEDVFRRNRGRLKELPYEYKSYVYACYDEQKARFPAPLDGAPPRLEVEARDEEPQASQPPAAVCPDEPKPASPPQPVVEQETLHPAEVVPPPAQNGGTPIIVGEARPVRLDRRPPIVSLKLEEIVALSGDPAAQKRRDDRRREKEKRGRDKRGDRTDDGAHRGGRKREVDEDRSPRPEVPLKEAMRRLRNAKNGFNASLVEKFLEDVRGIVARTDPSEIPSDLNGLLEEARTFLNEFGGTAGSPRDFQAYLKAPYYSETYVRHEGYPDDIPIVFQMDERGLHVMDTEGIRQAAAALGVEAPSLIANLNDALQIRINLAGREINDEALSRLAAKPFALRLCAASPSLIGDDSANGVIPLNLNAFLALRGHDARCSAMVLQAGFTHEVLGHEAGRDDEAALTREDLQLCGILAVHDGVFTKEGINALREALGGVVDKRYVFYRRFNFDDLKPLMAVPHEPGKPLPIEIAAPDGAIRQFDLRDLLDAGGLTRIFAALIFAIAFKRKIVLAFSSTLGGLNGKPVDIFEEVRREFLTNPLFKHILRFVEIVICPPDNMETELKQFLGKPDMEVFVFIEKTAKEKVTALENAKPVNLIYLDEENFPAMNTAYPLLEVVTISLLAYQDEKHDRATVKKVIDAIPQELLDEMGIASVQPDGDGLVFVLTLPKTKRFNINAPAERYAHLARLLIFA